VHILTVRTFHLGTVRSSGEFYWTVHLGQHQLSTTSQGLLLRRMSLLLCKSAKYGNMLCCGQMGDSSWRRRLSSTATGTWPRDEPRRLTPGAPAPIELARGALVPRTHGHSVSGCQPCPAGTGCPGANAHGKKRHLPRSTTSRGRRDLCVAVEEETSTSHVSSNVSTAAFRTKRDRSTACDLQFALSARRGRMSLVSTVADPAVRPGQMVLSGRGGQTTNGPMHKGR
jgi:hypothetical protein